MSCPVTVRLGVFALGAADAAERLLIESHLHDCQACRMELAQLEPLPGLLAGVPPEFLTDGPAPVGRRPGSARLRPVDASQTGNASGLANGWRTVLSEVAAAVLLLAGGIWLALPGATQHAGTAQRTALTLSAANPVTHVRVTATLVRTSWGTRIRLEAWGLPLNQPCRLIVRSRAGTTEVAGAWDAWRAGRLRVPASAPWRPADIASLQVATPSRTLVTVSAMRRGAQVPRLSGP